MTGLNTKPVKRGCQGRRAKRTLKPRKKPSAESHNVYAMRQKPEMRRWRGNYLFIWSAYGHRNF